MHDVTVTGSTVHFFDSERPEPHFNIDYGDDLLWAKPVKDGAVVAYRSGARTVLERRAVDATNVWMLVHEAADEVTVADDSRSLSVNGQCVNLPGKLSAATVRPDGIVVAVYPDTIGDGRTLYRYNRDGSLKWRVAERRYEEHVPLLTSYRITQNTLKAEGRTNEPRPDVVGVIIDYESGEVIAREDPR